MRSSVPPSLRSPASLRRGDRLDHGPLLRFLLLPIVAALAILSSASPVRADLADDVQRAIRSAELKKATVAVSIREVETGSPLIAVQAERPMIPASNMKVFTTGAFLHAFGPDFAFRTRMVRNEDDLIVLGDGDPAFGDPELLAEMTYTAPDGSVKRGLDVDSLLSIWVDAVKAAELGSIDELIIDARVFDDIGFHPNWPKDQRLADYCAEVWGLNFHGNVLHVWPRPRPGGPADISRIAPNAPWVVRGNATTSRTGARDASNFSMSRPDRSNDFTFGGNVKEPAVAPARATLHDMPAFFGRLLAERLRAAGIKVRATRSAHRDDPIFDGVPIGPEIRTPVATVLARCNTDSDNLYAESLFKRLGRAATKSPGSWENGRAAVRHAIAERLGEKGSLASTIDPDDGSGLSRQNRITASATTALLASLVKDPTLGPVYTDSLAVAGKTGTVQRRFKDLARTGCEVLCKTGYIDRVSCLSGIVVAPDGRRIAFSILCNDLTEANAVGKAKAMQERIVTAIAESMVTVHPRREALGGG